MTGQHALKRDGRVIDAFDNYNDAWISLLQRVPYSTAHAMEYEGWSIEPHAKIKPGDVVQLADGGEYIGQKPGDRAVIDSMYFDPDGDGEIMICFRASAYRDDRQRKLGLVEAIEMQMTTPAPYPWPYVSCSGGPLPMVKVADLTYAGSTEQRFWRFKDGRARAHNGEDYVETVNLWIWKGR